MSDIGMDSDVNIGTPTYENNNIQMKIYAHSRGKKKFAKS
jgi:hypothetical protein